MISSYSTNSFVSDQATVAGRLYESVVILLSSLTRGVSTTGQVAAATTLIERVASAEKCAAEFKEGSPMSETFDLFRIVAAAYSEVLNGAPLQFTAELGTKLTAVGEQFRKLFHQLGHVS